MSWDASRPDGSQPVNVGDDAIRENNAWLEPALNESLIFPGTTDTRGRLRLQAYNKAGQASITDPQDGQIQRRTDLHIPGLSVYDSTAGVYYLFANGRVARVNAVQAGNLVAALDSDNEGVLWVRDDQSNRIYVWDGSAGPGVLATSIHTHDEATRANATPTAIANGSWTDLDFSGGAATSGNVEVTPPAAGNWRIRVRFGLFLRDSLTGTQNIRLELMQNVAAAGWTTVRSWEHEMSGQSNTKWVEGIYSNSAPSAGDAHEYRLRAQADGNGQETDGAHQVGSGNITSYMEARLEARI